MRQLTRIIGRHDESCMAVTAKKPDTPESVTRNLRNLDLSRPLRADYQYCNLMYTAASHLVVVLSGRSFESFLRDRIWTPLEMRDTHLGVSGVLASEAKHQLAQGYCWDEDKQESYPAPYLDEPEGEGAGSIFSNVQDYAKWIRMMIKRTGPLSTAAHRELLRPRIICKSETEDETEGETEDSLKPFHSHLLYALGWEIETYRGYTVVGHDGCVSGFGSSMRYLPQLDWGIVLFGNSDGANPVADILCWHLIDELLAVPASERFDWDKFARQQKEAYDEKQERTDLYPERPDPPLPMAAPLQSHVGRYRNAGYHDFLVDLQHGQLHVDAKDRSFAFDLLFEHVSGEYFVAVIIGAIDGYREKVKAQFALGSDGVVQRLGIAFVVEMEDSMVWFTRVEDWKDSLALSKSRDSR